MFNSNIPSDRELPPTGKLIKSTVIAAAVALVLLITVVMPAEYGIDVTGIGKAVGLKKMGEIKVSLAKEVAADAALKANAPSVNIVEVSKVTEDVVVPLRQDRMQVTLAPNEGTEIKVAMSKGSLVNFKWFSDGGKANFDVHGDSQQLKINYHNYEKGSEVADEGTLVAAFDGSHGWYWRNRTSETITVTLETSGAYTDIKHMK